jgi:acyl CoA:acetate/3-ketoacid CoA transferase alpha subunit
MREWANWDCRFLSFQEADCRMAMAARVTIVEVE